MSRSPPQDDDSRSSSTDSPAPADNEESDFFHGANDSQSSLGVVNFQDMQVDDGCWPPVHRLPNEILIGIFSKLSAPSDLLHSMLVCKRWTRNAVDLLWHRPACTSWPSHRSICQTVALENPFFNYRDFIKRLNLAALQNDASDGSIEPLAVCTRVERLTLTNCRGLTDAGLTKLIENNSALLALDVSNVSSITEESIYTIAQHCKRLQGLNVSGCTLVSNESMLALADSCRYIKRLKLNECSQLRDPVIFAFAENCPNILEIDLQHCQLITNGPVTALFTKGRSLRELRLANCELVDDSAFLNLPMNRTYDHLRILDLTSCHRLTDAAVQKIIKAAPKLRNLVLAKCRLITDAAVYAIAELGKNLHYVHLGHCANITDEGVKKLVHDCTRIRYIDLGCCTNLTDDSVKRLALLPKLKRIGLVKCSSITDASVITLAEIAMRPRVRRDGNGMYFGGEYYSSALERVHLSYCTNLTLKSIIKLLNSCPRLTHLSLTGVQAFQRDDFQPYCRLAPPEFTPHQRDMFCVFSGTMVSKFREYLNTSPHFQELRDDLNPRHAMSRARGVVGRQFNAPALTTTYGDIYDQDNREGDNSFPNEAFVGGPVLPGSYPHQLQHPEQAGGVQQGQVPEMAHSLPIIPLGHPSARLPGHAGVPQATSHFYAPAAMISSFMTNDAATGPPPLSAFGHAQASVAGGPEVPPHRQASAATARSASGASTAQMHQQPATSEQDGADETL